MRRVVKMKSFFILLSFLFLSAAIPAQVPDLPSNPMTADGARHVSRVNNQYSAFKLFWENPSNVTYNDIYFSQDSNLVINMDSSALVAGGYDSLIVFDSLSLGYLNPHSKYYWRVVEHNSSGFTTGPIWYFISQSYDVNFWTDYFEGDLSNYTVIEPMGTTWDISYSNYAGGQAPELEFFNFNTVGTAYLILNDYFDLSPNMNPFWLNYSFDLWQGSFTIGIVYSLDEGNTWITLWQQDVSDYVPASQVYIVVPNENYVKFALFCTCSNSNSAGMWYVDNLILDSWLTVSVPPKQIRAVAGSDSLKVSLNWEPGYTVNPSWGYRIQRKNGLPLDTSAYYNIVIVGPSVLSIEDYSVQPDSTYTYRIQEREGPEGGFRTAWSNEATAYVPLVTPVELLNFYAEAAGSNIRLSWITATENNNLGFEIQRKQIREASGQSNWMQIGFVKGNGTTTEIHTYTFTDNNAVQGKYQYRLKQTDLNGSFKYSQTVEVTIELPLNFYLSQNYPNPFNPTTNIKYQIPEKGIVTLKIYDVLGNEIATLINEEKPGGAYTIKFDGSSLASGIYFYQMNAGSCTGTRKLILMK